MVLINSINTPTQQNTEWPKKVLFFNVAEKLGQLSQPNNCMLSMKG